MQNNAEKITLSVIRGVRFAPLNVHSAVYRVFAPPNGSNLGVSYYWHPQEVLISDALELFSKTVGPRLRPSECFDIIDRFLRRCLHPIISRSFLSQIGDGGLEDCIPEGGLKFLSSQLMMEVEGYSHLDEFWVPLSSVIGCHYFGSNFSIYSDTLDSCGQRVSFEGLSSKRISESIGGSWLFSKARSQLVVMDTVSAIVGAFYLTVHEGSRHSIVMKNPSDFLLYKTKEDIGLSNIAPYMPSISEKIIISEKDLDWLVDLDKIISDRVDGPKKIKSLKWLGRAWFSNGADRFVFLCLAVDALMPSRIGKGVSSEKISFIYEKLDGVVSREDLEDIFKRMRGDVLHGNAPDLYDSLNYRNYTARRQMDALKIAEILSSELVRRCVLPSLRPHEHPVSRKQELVKRLKDQFARYGFDWQPPGRFDLSKLG